MKYRGTVLGGPHDGEILDHYDRRMRMPVRRPATFCSNVDVLPTCSTVFLVDEYEWRQDDDGRGWWVRCPR